MAAVDKADYGLHPVHLAEFHGLVWLNLADDPAPLEEQVWPQLDYRLGGDRAKFARYDLAGLVAGKRIDYTVAANWKIIQENFQECYHCSTIHPELVDTLPQFRDLIAGSPATSTDGYHFADDKASFSVSGQAMLPRLPGLTDRDDRKYYGMVLRPNCFLSLLPDHVIVHRFEPVSPELTTVVCEWLFPPETVAAHDIDDTVELFHRVNLQDFAATEWCQPNMKSRAYANGGVLVPTRAGDHRALVLPVVPRVHGARSHGAGRLAVTAFATRAVHAGHDPAQHNGSVTTPIYQASTFVRPHARPVESGWDYSRIANPTRAALEECLAALDGGASAVAVASGMAACVTVIQALCRSGAHLVIPDNVYGGTWDLVHDVYQRWGLAYTAVDMADLDAVAAAIRPETALVWTEIPVEPAAEDHRHRRRRRPGAPGGRAAGGGRHLRLAVPATAHRARRGPGDPLHHQVPERPLRHHRRRGHRRRRGGWAPRSAGTSACWARRPRRRRPGWCSAGSRRFRCGCGRSARAASGSPNSSPRTRP